MKHSLYHTLFCACMGMKLFQGQKDDREREREMREESVFKWCDKVCSMVAVCYNTPRTCYDKQEEEEIRSEDEITLEHERKQENIRV